MLRSTWLTVPGMCVLAVLWPLAPVVVVLLIFFFLRSSSRCSFCRFCTSINSEMKLFFTWFFNTKTNLKGRRFLGSNWNSKREIYFLSTAKNTRWQNRASEANHIVDLEPSVTHWPLSPLWALQSVLTTQQMFKCRLQIKFLMFESVSHTEHHCGNAWLTMTLK